MCTPRFTNQLEVNQSNAQDDPLFASDNWWRCTRSTQPKPILNCGRHHNDHNITNYLITMLVSVFLCCPAWRLEPEQPTFFFCPGKPPFFQRHNDHNYVDNVLILHPEANQFFCAAAAACFCFVVGASLSAKTMTTTSCRREHKKKLIGKFFKKRKVPMVTSTFLSSSERWCERLEWIRVF